MSTHLLHFKEDDNHHDASSESPAAIMIVMTTHPASPVLCNATLEMCRVELERDGDDYDDDDFDVVMI